MKDRNLELSIRNENTRDKFHTEVVRFKLDQIMKHYKETMQAVDAQFRVADELLRAGQNEEGENIWRAQIIFLASAVDFYMHELTKYGLCEIYNENWMDTEKYNHLPMHMEVVERALKSGEELDWFLEYINGYYETVTMVSFESVKAQLNLLGIDLAKVANQAFYEKNGVEKTRDRMKRCLNELFYRRNIIAHQTDRAHTDARRYPITKEIVQRFIRDVGKIVEAIHIEVEKK